MHCVVGCLIRLVIDCTASEAVIASNYGEWLKTPRSRCDRPTLRFDIKPHTSAWQTLATGRIICPVGILRKFKTGPSEKYTVAAKKGGQGCCIDHNSKEGGSCVAGIQTFQSSSREPCAIGKSCALVQFYRDLEDKWQCGDLRQLCRSM